MTPHQVFGSLRRSQFCQERFALPTTKVDSKLKWSFLVGEKWPYQLKGESSGLQLLVGDKKGHKEPPEQWKKNLVVLGCIGDEKLRHYIFLNKPI